MNFVRGDVYRLRAPKNTRGHEQQGARYAIVVQSDAIIRSTILVAPTSRSAKPSSTRPEINLDNTPCLVLVEQISAVAPERLGDYTGRLDPHELDEIDTAIKLIFGLF